MKISIAILVAASIGLLAGCSSLENKSVAVSAGGTGIKATTAADSSTGTATPTVWMGIFDFLFLDHPKEDGDLIYYRSQAATFNSSAVTTTFVWMKQGVQANVTVKPNSTLSIPGLSVASGDSTVNITTIPAPSASTETDSSPK